MFGQTFVVAMRLVGALRFAHVEDSPSMVLISDRRVDAQLWRGNRIDRNIGPSKRTAASNREPTQPREWDRQCNWPAYLG